LYQIWEDGSSFRGDLKTMARGIVPQQYNIVPKDLVANPAAYMAHVSNTVKDLLTEGNFHRNGVDAQVIIPFNSVSLGLINELGPYEKFRASSDRGTMPNLLLRTSEDCKAIPSGVRE
jgi:hypothetical protein